MSEHKRDDLMATGKHAAWTGEPVTVVRAGVPPRDPQRSWLDRSTPSNSRHAAITSVLTSNSIAPTRIPTPLET